ncbi:MAG: hypothetical protein HFI45_10640 [Lachnospiraceae bacterium]|nr:hypothetical protein [Lachnospiraceae bacterium]
MSEPDYFKNALSNFTFEAACGGAIRHLADLGCSVAQIMEKIQFPTSYERVQKAVWEHLINTGVILLAQPGSGTAAPKAEFIKEYDKYGKVSFRKISVPTTQIEPIHFLEVPIQPVHDPASLLQEKYRKNGRDASYVSCDFVLEKDIFLTRVLPLLDKKQQEYLAGLPWPGQVCYHRLDLRMLEIVIRLYQGGCYRGSCFFLKTKEKVSLRPILPSL